MEDVNVDGRMKRGLTETWGMVELGTHCTYRNGGCIVNSPLKIARTVFLPDRDSIR